MMIVGFGNWTEAQICPSAPGLCSSQSTCNGTVHCCLYRLRNNLNCYVPGFTVTSIATSYTDTAHANPGDPLNNYYTTFNNGSGVMSYLYDNGGHCYCVDGFSIGGVNFAFDGSTAGNSATISPAPGSCCIGGHLTILDNGPTIVCPPGCNCPPDATVTYEDFTIICTVP